MSTLDQAMNLLADKSWEPAFNILPSQMTLYRCTGTINGSLRVKLTRDKSMMFMTGRIYISSFSRTSNNPGIYLPDIGLPKTGGMAVGIRGENPNEVINFSSQSMLLNTTETFTNASGSRLTFSIVGAFLCFS